MRIVGERFNTSRKPIDQFVADRDAQAVRAEAKAQVDAGADILDVNAGSRKETEVDDLLWMIDVIQAEFPDARLCIDSPNPHAVAAVIPQVVNDYMINSTTCENARFDAMAPVIAERECDVVALCIDERGLPKSADQTLDVAFRLVARLEELGVKRDRIYLDPIIQSVGTNASAATTVLDSIRRIVAEIEGVHLVCGLSNISYGLPERFLLNRTFLTLAMQAGLDSAIIDPLDGKLIGALRATEVLLGRDPWCQAYTRAFRQGRIKT